MEEINSNVLEPGVVKVDGELWNAITYASTPLSVGSTVVVDAVKGVRLIVSPIENNQI